ncbi:hypothetical protein [Natronorubrum tibetense]|uniref:hypothetical protein n=1 Tax=Natronorubrum tibetense TaxID=63128 RepID=UPI001F4C8111|nr:hypothetical protein [Natronorubrum tibetense]
MVVLAVVVAVFGLAMLPVGQAAQVSDVTVDEGSVTVAPDSNEETTTNEITISTDGEDGTVSPSVRITETPSGIDVDSTDPGEIEAGDSDTAELTITVAADADSGTVEGDVDGVAFSFDVTVDNPPLAEIDDDSLDLGDALVGETESGEIVVEEVGGDQGLDGVDWEVVNDDFDGDLSLTDMDGSGFGEGSIETTPGGEDTAQWEVTVDDSVDQHETLEWTVELSDQSTQATREVDVEARVIYPAEYGEIELDAAGIRPHPEFVFDEPRDQNDELTQTFEFDLTNDGDLPLEPSDVSASSSEAGLSITVGDLPDEIEGQSSETVEVTVTADTDLEEGEYDFSMSASAEDFDIDDETYDEDLEISHEAELGVEHTVSIGDVPIGESEQVATEIGEELGYYDVSNLEITLDEGPDSWLELEESPTELEAGDASQAVFELEFDTEADLGTDYEWQYEVEGDDVESETITVIASPVPLDLDPIRNDLSNHDGTVASDTLEIVDAMDDEMETADAGDVSLVLSFGSSSTLYLESMADATELIENGEHDDAQREVVQAAAAYNTMALYAEQFESAEYRSDSEAVLAEAETDLEELTDTQDAHYEERLESGERSLLEAATIHRELSRIALLQGDEDRADEHQDDADEAFEAYSESVSEGETAAQEAEETWTAMEDDQFVTVAGQPLLLNPANYDAVTRQSEELRDQYEAATAALNDAGETSRADSVASERDERLATLGTAQLSLVVATGIYGLVTVGIVIRTARRMYVYVQDTRESVSGDFLL